MHCLFHAPLPKRRHQRLEAQYISILILNSVQSVYWLLCFLSFILFIEKNSFNFDHFYYKKYLHTSNIKSDKIHLIYLYSIIDVNIFSLNMFKTKGPIPKIGGSLFHPSLKLGRSTVFFPRGLILGFHQGGWPRLRVLYFCFLLSLFSRHVFNFIDSQEKIYLILFFILLIYILLLIYFK